jgi:hypothetical protein
MRIFLPAILSLGLLVGCTIQESGPDYSNTKPGYYGGDGSSQEQAVLAVGVDQSAYAWIAQKYPGSKILDQALVVPPGKKRYDMYKVRKRDGKVIEVWFLISGGLDAFINGR